MHIFWLRDVKDDAWRGNDHFLHQILIEENQQPIKEHSAGFLRPNLVATSILKAESCALVLSAGPESKKSCLLPLQ
jgi:hypothetical protein